MVADSQNAVDIPQFLALGTTTLQESILYSSTSWPMLLSRKCEAFWAGQWENIAWPEQIDHKFRAAQMRKEIGS